MLRRVFSNTHNNWDKLNHSGVGGNVSETTELCITLLKIYILVHKLKQLVMWKIKVLCCMRACTIIYLTITYISDSQNIKGTVLEERFQHLLPVKVGHQTFYG